MKHNCIRCGREGQVYYNSKFFCKDCVELFGTCAMCKNSQRCGFYEDPAPIPKFLTVQETITSKEGMVVQQIKQVPNPKRAKAFCADENCTCLTYIDGKARCLRQFGTCEKYDEIEF